MNTPFIGMVMPFAGNFAPRGWAFCEGQLLSISDNTALFSILGTTYGGDGRTTFGLPDLRSRVPVSPGRGPGLDTVNLGQKGGNYRTQLNVNHLPSHSHGVEVGIGPDTNLTDTATNNRLATEARGGNDQLPIYTSDARNGFMAPDAVSVGMNGGNQPFNSRNPYLGCYWIIALVGVYPSRS